MPTYDYECEDCGHTFDVLQSITADPLEECPVCEGSLRRLLSRNVGFIFKGPGFYATDYKSSERKKRGKEEEKVESSEDSAPEKSNQDED